AGHTLTYTDAAGTQQTFTVTGKEDITVRELVIYPLRRSSDPTVIEFHLAWEIALKRASGPITIYLDAVKEKEEILAVG
ncbi:MAG TPA: hypothetical protein VJT09_05850, partial [Pyrinomonadaceae bacterium]|nr:hypothetical protein [Pyrinomonadaceae bacterium]